MEAALEHDLERVSSQTPFHVTCAMLSGDFITVSTCGRDTVGTLKSKVRAQASLGHVVLFLHDDALTPDDMPLSACGVSKGTTLTVIVDGVEVFERGAPRGGGDYDYDVLRLESGGTCVMVRYWQEEDPIEYYIENGNVLLEGTYERDGNEISFHWTASFQRTGQSGHWTPFLADDAGRTTISISRCGSFQDGLVPVKLDLAAWTVKQDAGGGKYGELRDPPGEEGRHVSLREDVDGEDHRGVAGALGSH